MRADVNRLPSSRVRPIDVTLGALPWFQHLSFARNTASLAGFKGLACGADRFWGAKHAVACVCDITRATVYLAAAIVENFTDDWRVPK
jgi:hypothetical protein